MVLAVASWASSIPRVCQISRGQRGRRIDAVKSNLATPVGLSFKFEVQELPPETSAFYRNFGIKKNAQQHQGTEIGTPPDKIDRLDFSQPGDILQFIVVSAGLIFLFWVANYVLPQFVFKDVFAMADAEKTKDKQETQEPPPPPVPPLPPLKTNSKRYRTFNKKKNVIDIEAQ